MFRAHRWLAALALAVAGCGGSPAPRPNLVLVSVDTLRPDRLACYGGAAGVGGALCAVGDAGVRFTWAFSTAPSTAPALASVMTSRLPRDHGVGDQARTRLDGSLPTLADRLAEAGYATAAFVANPVVARGRGFEQGFSVYDDVMKRRERSRPLVEREAAELTDATLAWARVARTPWFVWVHYQDPHGPYEPPGAAPPRDPRGAEGLPLLTDQSGWNGIPAYQALGDARAPDTYTGRYLDEIRYLDGQLARLVTGLDELGDRPGILVTADHGEAFGEDGFWFAHGHSLGVDQIRIPLLWRPPGATGPGRVVDAPVSALDVAPTLLAAAGVSPPEGFAGRVLPGLDGGPPGADRALFAEHRLRLAVVAGGLYYARDRAPLAAPVDEPVTGGRVPPLPPRTSTLGRGGEFAGYDPPAGAGADALERLAAGFLAEPGRTAAATGALDAETREALRALGYLE
jgi:arylsulfatase A-like enzyme